MNALLRAVSHAAAASMILTGLTCVAMVTPAPSTAVPTYSTVDTSGQGASQYRVPAIAVTNSGTIVVCYDRRNLSSSDLPADIDIVCKRSTDGGATWSARSVAALHSNGDTDATAYGVSDAQLTYDRSIGRLFLAYTAGPPGIGIHNSSISNVHGNLTTVHPLLRYSDDEGVTWSAIIDLTASLKDGKTIQGIFATSGHGTQLADGTLVSPYAFYVGGVLRGALATSTDHGATWHMGAQLATGTDENHVVERMDGTLLDDSRSSAGVHARLFSTAPSAAGPWSAPVTRTDMPDPICNGDIMAVGPDFPGWLLESNPASTTSRVNLVVRLSQDDGVTWPYALVVDTGAAGYSTMARLADGSIGVLYENQIPSSLKFARFDLADVLASPA